MIKREKSIYEIDVKCSLFDLLLFRALFLDREVAVFPVCCLDT